MNIALRARDVLTGISPKLVDEFDGVLNRINFLWAKGHNPQTGTHKTLVFDPKAATTLTVGPTGLASALPANPAGYLVIYIGNTSMLVPYYKMS